MKIKLSVIVPVYNVKKYLSTCIESILNQTYADFEVVLVDDGSTDGCSEVCDEYKYKDARVRVIHQENKGLLYARYVGICMAKGEYATFVDSDDWLDLHTYEIAMKNISSEIDMISFGMIRYYTSERMFKDANKIKAGEYFREDIEEKVIPKMFWDEDLHTCGLDPSLCNKIVKRSLWLKQFEKAKELGVYFGEDAAIAYPMVMEMQHLIIVDECLYYHRLRPESEMPSYLLDEMFYDKLYTWYVYLRECLRENASLLRQLECYYYHAMGKRVCSNKKSIAKSEWIFPFNCVEQNSNIILYGAGAVGQKFYKQVQQISYCEIKLWVDQNYQAYLELGVKHPCEIKNYNLYDYVVIANANENIAKEIRTYLISLGVDERKIVWSAACIQFKD